LALAKAEVFYIWTLIARTLILDNGLLDRLLVKHIEEDYVDAQLGEGGDLILSTDGGGDLEVLEWAGFGGDKGSEDGASTVQLPLASSFLILD
jgi:hypothetical protein